MPLPAAAILVADEIFPASPLMLCRNQVDIFRTRPSPKNASATYNDPVLNIST